MNLLDDYIPNRYYYVGGTAGTLLVSCLQAFASMEGIVNDFLGLFGVSPVSFAGLSGVLDKLPLANIGVAWLIPAAIGAFLFGIVGKNKARQHAA